jgi:Uma2 family endonuclease
MVSTPVTIPLQSVTLSPGSHLLVDGVTWDQYEALLLELGADRRVPRINYCDGTLEIMSPLPAHERPHRIIAYIVTAILDAQDRPWEDFGSTTYKKPKRAGVEPDTCFYVDDTTVQARRLMRVNLEVDPPPDLAIESDVTSKTTLDAYQVMAVPEVWIYDNGRLTIYQLQEKEYLVTTASRVFPDLEIVEFIPRLVQQAFQQGTSTMLKELRRQLTAGDI